MEVDRREREPRKSGKVYHPQRNGGRQQEKKDHPEGMGEKEANSEERRTTHQGCGFFRRPPTSPLPLWVLTLHPLAASPLRVVFSTGGLSSALLILPYKGTIRPPTEEGQRRNIHKTTKGKRRMFCVFHLPKPTSSRRVSQK